MFCPRCQAEYVPHIRRCSECDVPLVERLCVTHGEPERTRVSGFVLFKELGAFIVLPFMILATMLVLVALRDNPFEIQIASIIMHTGFVFFFVFCDAGPGRALSRKAKGTRGFNLGEKAVREKLPLLFYIHGAFLSTMLAVESSAILLRPHLSRFLAWEMGRSEPFVNCFDLIVSLTGVVIIVTQITISRRILGRAVSRKSDDS